MKSLDQLVSTALSIDGWTTREQLSYLVSCVWSLPERAVVVEVGVWKGRSAIAMALSAEGSTKKIFAVDPWIDYETTQGMLSSRLKEFNVLSIEAVFQEFLHYRTSLGLDSSLNVIRNFSAEAAAQWSGAPINMLFIDGQHTYAAVTQDLTEWFPLLTRDAVICGDDWSQLEVSRAVQDYAQCNNFEIVLPCHNTWQLSRFN